MAMRNGVVVCTTGANGAAYCYLANKAATPSAGNTAAMALNSSQILANQKMMMMNRRMDLSSMANNNNAYSQNALLSPPSQSQSVTYLPSIDRTNNSSKNTSGRGSRRNSNNNGSEHSQYSCEYMSQSLLDNNRCVEIDASPVSPALMQKKH